MFVVCFRESRNSVTISIWRRKKRNSVGMEWLHFMCIGTLKLVNRAPNRCYVYKNKNSNSIEIKFTNAQKKATTTTQCVNAIQFSFCFLRSSHAPLIFVCSFGIYIFFFFLIGGAVDFFFQSRRLYFSWFFFS